MEKIYYLKDTHSAGLYICTALLERAFSFEVECTVDYGIKITVSELAEKPDEWMMRCK